jgi:uroporphyrinogen-III synthase
VKAGPLAGRVVLVTRPHGRGGRFAARLRELGAEPILAPTIRLDPPPGGEELEVAIRAAAEGRYAWIVFTSTRGATEWSRRATRLGVEKVRARLAAVGPATAEFVRQEIGQPDLVPPVFTTADLAEAFPSGSGSVLLPRADLATDELEVGLQRKGWTPVRVDAYRVSLAEELPPDARRALKEGRVEAITFTSPSAVEGFVRLAGVPDGPATVCIGPVTAEAARNAGFTVNAVADPHTTDGLVEAVLRALDRAGG